MEALREVNRRAMQLQGSDAGHPGAVHRMGFGAWFFTEDETPAPPDEEVGGIVAKAGDGAKKRGRPEKPS